MVKTEIYYRIQKPGCDESWNGNYQTATIDIYEVDPVERERINRYHPNDFRIDTDSLIASLSYQRDRHLDINREETTDPAKRVYSPWYAEEIERIKNDYSGISIDKVERLAKILKRMEKELKAIHDKGLSVQNGNDQFELRKFLLKAIGAREIIYSNYHLRLIEGVMA